MDRELLERVRAWTWRRQRLERAGTAPGEALRAVVCAYSSHPSAPLTLLARSAPFGADAFAAVEAAREAVRLPGPRGSIFLMPVATAPMVRAATALPLAKLAPRLKYAGFTPGEYEVIKPRLLEALTEPRTGAELAALVPVEGGQVDIAARVMAHEGLVLRIAESLRTDKLRYVATEAWLGRPLVVVDQVEALAWLAGEYLRAFGPATLDDFAWWAGATKTAAKVAFGAHETVDVGDGLLLRGEDGDAWEAVEPVPADTIALVPKWDAYTMGYAPKGRARLIADEHLTLAYTKGGTGGAGATSGDGLPLVLRGGRAIANWSHTFTGQRMKVEVRPWAPGAFDLDALRPAVDEIAALLGASSVESGLKETT